jgi:hypothetical protein
VRNLGSATLGISSITASSQFSETNNCGSSVAGGANCSLTVTFTPTEAGPANGTVTVDDNASGSPQIVTLTGTGTLTASVSPTSVNFGNQFVGITSPPQNVTLTNNGLGTMTITSIAITGSSGSGFAQTNNCGGSLGALGSCTISVTFTPAVTGTLTGTLTVTDDATNNPQTVSLSGFGIQPQVTISPTSLNFGNETVGDKGLPKLATLTNTGNTSLSITSIAITGADSGDYSETNTCGSSVAAGASCDIFVTFTPAATGTRTAAVSVTDNAPGSPQTVSLTGTGILPVVTLTPSSLNLGNVLLGSTSAPQNVTLSVNGPMTISSITTSAQFSQTNTCGSGFFMPGTCTITVTFTPTALGVQIGTLSVADSASGSPQTVALSGTGVQSGVTFSPTSLTFPTQLVFTTSAPQNVTLTNSGTGMLTISSVKTSGNFAQTNSCGSSVSPGASCTISVTFTPGTRGTLTGAVTVADNAPGSPQSVGLTGTGTFVDLSPASLNFGSQPVGTTSLPMTITLSNKGGVALSIGGIGITGVNAGDFAQTNTCGSSVPRGGSCFISVTFTPSADGKRTAAVSITDNGGGSPQTLSLSGLGTF